MAHPLRALLSRKRILIMASSLIILSALAFSVSQAQPVYAGASMCPANTTWVPGTGAPTLSYGSTGGWVIALQESLNLAYLDASDPFINSPYNFKPLLATDGIFGPLTRNAVLDYQTAHHLQVDGIVGPKTWGSLGYCGVG